MGSFTFEGKHFLLDGQPYVIRSGAIHYFRIPREYWYDRLLKLKECGFNTVETYTAWNLHERREGAFDFEGDLDIGAFIDTAASLGLKVILRPGPYICAEWDMGGLPSWLLTYEKMTLRTRDSLYIEKVERYFANLLPIIRPRLIGAGGNVIMLQIENEYGSFGNDKVYLQRIVDIYRKEGMDCLLFTSDGPTYTMLSGGSLEGYLCTGNYGSHPEENIPFLENYRPNQPDMCCEYWCGWFDHWGEEHHVRPSDEVVENIGAFLDMDASFNIYMFCGGTNFGFMNGANYDKQYQPTVTSYDYNAPLSEAGDRTPLYYSIKALMEKRGIPLPESKAKDSKKRAYGTVELSESAFLFDNLSALSKPSFAPNPQFMEDVGQDLGYILYETEVVGPNDGWGLSLDCVHDRAKVYVDKKEVATLDRNDPEGYFDPHVGVYCKKGERSSLHILCENMGRVNYGRKIRDRKGINGVRFGNQYHFGWNTYPLPMDDLSPLAFKKAEAESLEGPVFLRGELIIEGEVCDTFLRLDGFTKGFVTVNGKNIGRYYNTQGPQKTLYIPAPYLKEGKNEIIVFESDRTTSRTVTFSDRHDLG